MWQDHVSNEVVRSRCSVPMSLAQLARLRRLGWAGHVLRHNELMIHKVMFSRANSKRRGHHRTLVADLADDFSHVCSFASLVSSLPYDTEQFNHACSLFVTQAGDLGCFKCPSCAKPYISSTWNHAETCQQVPSAHWGDNGLNLNLNLSQTPHTREVWIKGGNRFFFTFAIHAEAV